MSRLGSGPRLAVRVRRTNPDWRPSSVGASVHLRSTDTAAKWNLLSPTQISVIIDSLPPEVRPAAVFMANTGLRIGSVLATRTEWIDEGRRQVNYPAGVMKARRKHTVDLNDSAQAALGVALEHTDDPERPFPFGYWFV